MASNGQSREIAPAADVPPDGELDLGAVGRALWRKKLWVLIPACLAAGLTFAVVNVITPRYKSEARILIEGRESPFLRPDAEKGADRDRSTVDPEAITSQVQLALSREVARQVIRQLKLNEKPEFDPVLRGVGPLRQILILVGLSRDPLRMTPEERVFETYYERVQAFQVEKSRVIGIEFQSADPELAARGANAVAEAYLALLQVVKQDQTRAAGQWLAGEIETLRTKVSEAESKVEQFRSKSNLFMGTNNNTLSNQQLGDVNAQIAVARSQKADADAKSQAIRAMLRSGRPIESGDVINSELIRRLNEQRVTLRAQLAEQASTLLDGHPRIKELRAQIGDLERQIRGEAERLVRSLENDARIAGARVDQMSADLERLKRQAASTNEQDVQLRALEREAKSQRDLLESYLAKYREATARDTLGASPADARIISRAIVSNTPYFPKKLPIVLIATFATLLLGAGFITTGELLAGNVYRPGGVAAAIVPIAEGALRIEPYGPVHPAVAGAASGAAVATEASQHSLDAVVDHLRGRPGGRSRSVIAGLSDAAGSAAGARALTRKLAAHGRAIMVDLAPNAAPDARPEHAAKGIADLVRGQASFSEIISRDRASRAHMIATGWLDGDGLAVLGSDRLAIALDALERTYDHMVLHIGVLQDQHADRLPQLAPHIVLAAPDGEAEAAKVMADAARTAGCQDVSIMIGASDAVEPIMQPSAAAA